MSTSEQPVDDAWSVPIEPFKKGDMKHSLLTESSFSFLFPRYRENYIRECWPLVKHTLSEYGITANLDVVQGRMEVLTTRKTWDPYIILKARDLIKLLARSVPYEQAIRVLEDKNGCEIIKINSMVRKKERFVKRRQRLIGSKGITLKALELATDCYVMVQGGTVCALGPYKGLQQVRRIVVDTMNNTVHPYYGLKALLVKRKLASDPTMTNEDWGRHIPKYVKSKPPTQKKPKIKRKVKEYTPFPPPQPESKVDKLLASGEYFLKESDIRRKKLAEKMEKKAQAEVRRQEKRAKSYIPPPEKSYWKKESKTPQKQNMEGDGNPKKSKKKRKSTE